MYNKHSLKATEFIDDEEIKETLCFAQENKHNKELISSLIERAADCKGLTHREAAVLLECDLPASAFSFEYACSYNDRDSIHSR